MKHTISKLNMVAKIVNVERVALFIIHKNLGG